VWRAVGLLGIEDEFSFKSGDAANCPGQLADAYAGAGAAINRLAAVEAIDQKHHGIGQIIGIEKLPQWAPGAPDDNLCLAGDLGRMEFADKGGQDMARRKVEIVVAADTPDTS
jgi:hypothetical protein